MTTPKSTQRAGAGKHVTVELITTSGEETLEFEIVPDESADFEHGFLGASTPLARAITGLSAGQAAPYRVGDGRMVRVLSVEPSKSAPPEDTASKRAENYRRAVDQSDRTNAMIFASSFSGKWGDYDPTGFISGGPEPPDIKASGFETGGPEPPASNASEPADLTEDKQDGEDESRQTPEDEENT